jgi:hypothetical protein
MVLLALVLVVLMIFAAFSVDIGTAYAQRRQNQGSVDTAALAGGVHFIYSSGGIEAAVKEVKDRVALDMGTKIKTTDWAACTDPGHLPILSTAAGFAPNQGNPCISFERSADTSSLQMRVRLPDVSNATNFASVIGIDKLTTHAVAQVNIGSLLGGAFPAFVYSGANAGGIVCVLDDSPGHNGFCSKGDDDTGGGNFGTFPPFYYRQGWGCKSGNSSPDQAAAIAAGLDHLLGRYINYPGGGDSRINGGNGCTVFGPNILEESTGNLTQTRTEGLLTGTTVFGESFNGRLVDSPYADGNDDGVQLNVAIMGTPKNSSTGWSIDNAPLWYFLDPAKLAGAPPECVAAAAMSPKRNEIDLNTLAGGTYAALGKPEDLMSACLSAWTPDDGPIFKTDFAKSHRAVSVPRVWEPVPNGNSGGVYHIKDFVPMFLTGEYNGTDAHWAGDPIRQTDPAYSIWNDKSPGQMKDLISGAAGFYVPCGSLPETICVPTGDPADNAFGGEVNGVTLTK